MKSTNFLSPSLFFRQMAKFFPLEATPSVKILRLCRQRDLFTGAKYAAKMMDSLNRSSGKSRIKHGDSAILWKLYDKEEPV